MLNDELSQKLKKARIIFSTLSLELKHSQKLFKSCFRNGSEVNQRDRNNYDFKRFDSVIIDEASMSNVPFTCIGAVFAKRLILAGDDKQLAPTVVTQDEILKLSVFERLF